MFDYGFLNTFPVFVNNRKFRKDCTNSGYQSRFTHMVVIIDYILARVTVLCNHSLYKTERQQ